MTVNDAYKQLSVLLQTIYEQREANNIAALVIEFITGYTNSARIVHKNQHFTDLQQEFYHRVTIDLLSHKPVQYVLNEAHWYGMSLFVNEAVLIPRPETEELVDWMITDLTDRKNSSSRLRIIDIGTGSGCIAIAMKKAFSEAHVCAADISDAALEVAIVNAKEQNAGISFLKTDILNREQWQGFGVFDCIVSNPPYITQKEAGGMRDNVLSFEPHTALFVPDNEPLLFYDVISSFAREHISRNGLLYFEINEMFCSEVVALLSGKGFMNIVARDDMQGRSRMVKAEAPGR